MGIGIGMGDWKEGRGVEIWVNGEGGCGDGVLGLGCAF